MTKFTMSWKMCYEERLYNEKLRCNYWKHELDAEWIIKCICDQSKSKNPAFIEVHRKSTTRPCLVSGILEMRDERERQSLLQKTFVCFIEKGKTSARIDLAYRHEAIKNPPKVIMVIGEMIVSVHTESSRSLAELVHLTSFDCSSLTRLSNDMEELVKEPLFTDITLKCGSLSIAAHKGILSARSPVFKAMFSCPMRETVENEVIIEGIEAPVMQAMIKHIYTGKIGVISPIFASDLLFAANQYQIASLESACCRCLTSNMSMENAFTIMAIADYVSPDMKNIAIDFICDKCTDYSVWEKTNDWITLKNKNPTLALEILGSVVKYREEKLKKRT